ncbi:hypothetical protein [Mannheimia massilioguelmaensis]|uniref:hypothetical protein n=1 Tax=Mannheimia massilioguelmaensis TaxID=1604354 RepID=UPI0005C916AC|nr:hypothetical protein [Mannheimia massilioguelmaensis]
MKGYEQDLQQAFECIQQAEAVVIGGASGMSTANGHDFYHNSDYFKKHFSEFQEKYGVTGCFKALYYAYPTSKERWAYLSKHATAMFDEPAGQTYLDLFELVKDKQYFVITTNQDMQFSKVFDEERIAYPQGDAHWLQCKHPCHDGIYPAEEAVRKMSASIIGTEVDPDTIPHCPHCGAELEPWIRSYEFLEGKFWAERLNRYEDFVIKNHHKKILFIELGVGKMTPNIIKWPFAKMVNSWANASLIRINKDEDHFPMVEENKSVIFDHNIAEVLHDLVAMKKQNQAKVA